MMIVIQTVSSLAFAFVAYLLASVLMDSLKDGNLVKPIAITICSVTISYHLYLTGASLYIVGAFIGFFAQACVSTYHKKVKAPAVNKRKKVVNINP